jgi:predicted nucleotidyltransferase
MAINATTRKKINRFLRLLKNDFNIQAAYLFGSAAKGKANSWSDIDIAIVSQDFRKDSFDAVRQLIPYILKIDSAIEVHPFRPEVFSEDNPFVKEILATGLRIL